MSSTSSSAQPVARPRRWRRRPVTRFARSSRLPRRAPLTSSARPRMRRAKSPTRLERLDAMESELSALIESLRTGSNRLNADLQLLEGNLSDVQGAVSPRERFEPELPEVPEPAEVPEAGADDLGNGAAHTESASVASDTGDDTEGTRLIALNMALNGTPRDETERYLAENFQLEDAHGLLDEVYASVEG